MKELIEEFRLIGLAGHTHHRTAEWKDCEYAFCNRRYQLWFAAKDDEVTSKPASEEDQNLGK